MTPQQLQAMAALLRCSHDAKSFAAALRQAEAMARRQGGTLAPVWRQIEAEIVRLGGN
jgi:hypothetical protein